MSLDEELNLCFVLYAGRVPREARSRAPSAELLFFVTEISLTLIRGRFDYNIYRELPQEPQSLIEAMSVSLGDRPAAPNFVTSSPSFRSTHRRRQ